MLKTGWMSRVMHIALALAGVLAGAAAGLALYNNVTLRPASPEEFAGQIERALTRSTHWVDQRRYQIAVTRPNTALLHMLDDMADMSAAPIPRRIVESFLRRPSTSLWQRMVDENAAFVPPPDSEIARYQDYQRWLLHALAPSAVPLTDADRAAMFDRDEHVWGSLTHQLFALYIYRQHQGASQELDSLINRLCERIAAEAVWDFRVTDLYVQRIAFLLAAGRPDLVRQRWVERALAHQEVDGGWSPAWHGWGPDLFRFTLHRRPPDAHATVQGMWIVYMLTYRYPAWPKEGS